MEHNLKISLKKFCDDYNFFVFWSSADLFEYVCVFILILPFTSNMRNKDKFFDITNNTILAYTDVIKITQTCLQLFTCRVLLELGFKVHILEQHSILSS